MKKREAGRKSLFAVLLWRLAVQYKRVLIDSGKVHAAKVYVEGVSRLRTTVLMAVWAVVCIAVAMLGFAFLHIALILASGWDDGEIALFLLICGAVYMIAGVGVLIYFMSGKVWSEKFKVNEVVDKAMQD